MTTDDDPISAASSGLRALGVAPQRRVETLGLVSALIDLADERGEVLLDSDLMATEERLGIDACLEGYEWLERLDVIRRTWSGWVIQNYAAHNGPEGMTEAAMAVLQKHFTAIAEDTSVVPIAPEREVAAVAPIVMLKPWRKRVPVIAASVAAGVAVLAGATQFVPQAAVTGRNVAAHSTLATKAPVGTLAPLATAATDAATTAVSAGGGPAATLADAATTTTSTTLLPALPCLGDVLRGLGNRTGLRTTQTTQNAPGVLPCP
jgi:hypothetical protein